MLPKVNCKKCKWRLDNSNFCLKRLQIISFKDKRCKDYRGGKSNFKIEVIEEKVKIILKTEEPIIEKPKQLSTTPHEVNWKSSSDIKVKPLWKRIFQKVKNILKKK